MLLTQILQPGCIKIPLERKDKEGVIGELVELLDSNGMLLDKGRVLEAVMERERVRSTGTGLGIAIPHGKCEAVRELVMAMGVAEAPVEFESVDGKPVKIIILLVSPTDQIGPHIQALAGISRLALDEEFKKRIDEATSADDVYSLLDDRENQ